MHSFVTNSISSAGSKINFLSSTNFRFLSIKFHVILIIWQKREYPWRLKIPLNLQTRRPPSKTIISLSARVNGKLTSHILKRLVHYQFGVKVQTFELAASAFKFKSEVINTFLSLRKNSPSMSVNMPNWSMKITYNISDPPK